MKFVALVSGGKDSCFNILHCLSNGHELIALANLHPRLSATSDEIDSFMYQTVGFNVLTQYQECIGVPMYRQEILGSSKNVDLQYEKTLDDETEDLYRLLTTVKQNHPDIEAVSVGAILSTYQRIRVEHVCQRLGLVSLSYLWQRDQDSLMQEMCQPTTEMDARILKVAAYGLSKQHLGLKLSEIYPTLLKLNKQFEVHICGEGGEFETIVLDAPFFVKKKINVTDSQVVSHSENDDVYYLKLDTEVGDKQQQVLLDLAKTNWNEYITEQPLLTNEFKEIYNSIELTDEVPNVDKLSLSKEEQSSNKPKSQTAAVLGNKLYISNLSSSLPTIEEQTAEIFTKINQILESHNIKSTRSILSVNLLVASMQNFAKINSIYTTYFSSPLPPSRTCFESTLPQNQHLSLSCVVLTSNDYSQKMGLHVQSRSYWAPANIGPYSQANYDVANYMANLAGQIPLIPAIMELPNNVNIAKFPNLGVEGITDLDKLNTVLSLKHIVSVKDVIDCSLIGTMVCYVTDKKLVQSAKQAFELYNEAQEDEKFIPSAQKHLLIAEVSNLPKNASIEWSGISYKKYVDYAAQYDEDTDEEKDSDAFEKQNSVANAVGKETFEILESNKTLVLNNKEFVSTLWFDRDQEGQLIQLLHCKKLHIIVYAVSTEQNLKLFEVANSLEFVPVKSVVNFEGKVVDFGVIVRGSI